MKEYLKGLGKRSTSVDANIMDVGSSGSDTWRIFHELKGKITKTVEEKLTEIKSDRRSVTPLFSGKSSPRHGRLRAGANSQENSSVSDSEDVSENSNKDESKSSLTNDASPTIIGPQPTSSQSLQPTFVQYTSENNETPSSIAGESTKKKHKKDRKSGLRHRKGGERVEEDSNNSDSNEMIEEDIVESGVEVSEETKFPSDTSFYEDISTVDFRVYPPITYTPAYIDVRRKSSTVALRTEIPIFKKVWAYHNIIISVLVFIIVFFVPIPSYIKGMVVGVLITLFYHLIVGVSNWYLPNNDLSSPTTPFMEIANYSELPILEVPLEPEIDVITKFGGWMNELTETYNPDTYHINNTQSVYVRLNGSILRISHPKSKIPKRHLWNERKLKMKFIHQRIYDISNCSIKLLPEGITRKRRWSKKYPLCIMLTKESKRRETVVALPRLDNEQLRDPTGTVSQTSSLGEETGELDTGIVDEVVILKPYFDDRASQCSLISTFSTGSNISLLGREESGSIGLSGLRTIDQEDSLLSTLGQEEETISFRDIREKLFARETTDANEEETFCIIDGEPQLETCLYLFSRTDRQKEDWYRKFVEAMKQPYQDEDDDDMEAASVYQDTRRTSTVTPGLSDITLKRDGEYTFDDSCFSNCDFVTQSALRNADMNYIEFMNKFHLQVNKDRKSERIASSLKLDREVDCDVMWINAFVGRILYDVLQNPKWIDKIQGKIQKKLSTIKLPLFVEELLLTGIDLGRDVPMIHRVSRPILDDHGLWVDLDVTFNGCIMLTIETKINLVKMKKEEINLPIDAVDEQLPPEEEGTPEKRKSPIYDSSVEDSAESSPTETDEEHRMSSSDEAPEPPNLSSTISIAKSPTPSTANAVSPSPTPLLVPSPTPSTVLMQEKKKAPGKGVIKMMNKFVSSQFFQTASEYRYIKRAIEGVSNTQITLTVEIRACTGQLAVNFPPPPSDRLWFGFRGNPRIWITVKPKFGHRQVNISYITNWLEKKLLLEFQKKFVLPNMDDLVISPMTTDLPI